MAGPGLVDTPNLRPYKNQRLLSEDPAAIALFINQELARLSATQSAIITACKLMEARLVAAGI